MHAMRCTLLRSVWIVFSIIFAHRNTDPHFNAGLTIQMDLEHQASLVNSTFFLGLYTYTVR